ncbi:MAG: zinc ribbon domain-containing protein [Methanomassiliicoccales archaeon]|nr:zinc ribbon domain-containing protein [Methanomassiliicoccales archaeon]
MAILIILLILCWPAALVYFLMKWDDSIFGPTRTCPGCGANISMNYNVCPHCGRSFNGYGYKQYPGTNGSTGASEQRFCFACGELIAPGGQFCSRCGSKVE